MKLEDLVELLADIPKAELNLSFGFFGFILFVSLSHPKTGFGVFSLSVINYFVKDKPHQDSLVQRYLNTIINEETPTNPNFYNRFDIQQIIKGLRHPFFRENTKNWRIIIHATTLRMTSE